MIADHRPVRGRIAAALLALLLVAVAVLPADAARRRSARVAYSPPKAAMIVDGNTGNVLHASNPDEPRYPASLTKVMTLYMLFEAMEAGRLAATSDLRVSARASEQQPSKLGLRPGETIKVHQAIGALVTKSANDAAVVVAEALAGSEDAFARQMTMRARALGMTRTTFRNASGLPHLEQRTTARDMVTLAQGMLDRFPKRTGVFEMRSFRFRNRTFRNHNSLLYSYQGMEGMKTGFTSASGFNLIGCARRGQRHLIGVVMGGASAGGRNATMRQLLNVAWAKASTVKQRGKRIRPAPPDEEIAVAALRPALRPATTPALVAPPPAAVATLAGRPSVAAAAAVQPIAARPVAPPPAEAAEATPPADPAQFRTRPAVASLSGFQQVDIAVAPQRLGGVSFAPLPAEPPFRAATPVPAEIAALQPAAVPATPAAVPPAPKAAAAATALAMEAPRAMPGAGGPSYQIQIGSHASDASARAHLGQLKLAAADIVGAHQELTVAGDVGGKTFYRARFAGYSEPTARKACAALKGRKLPCLIVRAE